MNRSFLWLTPVLLIACSTPNMSADDSEIQNHAAGSDAAFTIGDSALSARAKRLTEMALQQNKSIELLRELTEVAPRRLSGSENADRAVEWAVATMQRLGLANVRRERVMVPHWLRGAAERCRMESASGGEDLDVVALGGSVGTPDQGITGEVLMVRSFEELHQKSAEAKGKIIFFNRPMPRGMLSTFLAYRDAVPQRGGGASEAAKVGGVFALVRSMTTKVDDVPHTGAMHYEAGVPMIPTAAISTLDAETLAARLQAGENPTLTISMACRSLPDVESANVVGELVGSELPDEIVVIGGHLDSWDLGPGAQDDGAGCIHSLEAVRLIQAAGIKPRRTIRVVLFMNEENGLRGGRAYAADHAAELGKHVAAIESDSGGFLPRGFSCSATGARGDLIRALVAHLIPVEMGAYTSGGGGADIGPMGPAGVTLLGLSTVNHRYFDYHHSAIDDMNAVNERELALGAAAMAYIASALADTEL